MNFINNTLKSIELARIENHLDYLFRRSIVYFPLLKYFVSDLSFIFVFDDAHPHWIFNSLDMNSYLIRGVRNQYISLRNIDLIVIVVDSGRFELFSKLRANIQEDVFGSLVLKFNKLNLVPMYRF